MTHHDEVVCTHRQKELCVTILPQDGRVSFLQWVPLDHQCCPSLLNSGFWEVLTTLADIRFPETLQVICFFAFPVNLGLYPEFLQQPSVNQRLLVPSLQHHSSLGLLEVCGKICVCQVTQIHEIPNVPGYFLSCLLCQFRQWFGFFEVSGWQVLELVSAFVQGCCWLLGNREWHLYDAVKTI